MVKRPIMAKLDTTTIFSRLKSDLMFWQEATTRESRAFLLLFKILMSQFKSVRMVSYLKEYDVFFFRQNAQNLKNSRTFLQR